MCNQQTLETDSTNVTLLASIKVPVESEFLVKYVADLSARIWIKGSNDECKALQFTENDAQISKVSCDLKHWAICEKSQSFTLDDLRKKLEALETKILLDDPSKLLSYFRNRNRVNVSNFFCL